MKATWVALVLTVAAGCGEDASVPIDARDAVASVDADAALSCAQIAAQLQAKAAATSGACGTASDCLAVGYPVRDDGVPTCNCGVAFAQSCGGAPVNAAAWGADAETRALEGEWFARCVPLGAASGAPTICDCSRGTTSCIDSQCVASTYSCFADAGVQ